MARMIDVDVLYKEIDEAIKVAQEKSDYTAIHLLELFRAEIDKQPIINK